MKFATNNKKINEIKSDCLMVSVFDDGKLRGATKLVNTSNGKLIEDFIKNKDIQGKIGQTRIIPVTGKSYKRIVLVGCGAFEKFSQKNYRKAVISALKKISLSNHKKIVSLIHDGAENINSPKKAYRMARVLAESWHAISYQYTTTKESNHKKLNLRRIEIGTNGKKATKDLKIGLEHGDAIGKATQLVRHLGDLPANICTPSYLASVARKIVSKNKSASLKVLNEAQMKKLGMNSLLSVTAGAQEPAKMIIAEFKNGQKSQKPVAIVGKGITFDTGGISLKPSNKMDEMKYDMCGAATTIGLLQMVTDLNLPINAVFVVPACENIPSSTATLPGDVVKSMSGTTIEVLNTDAEGRLILADALTYTQRYKPKLIIDMATLTGACVVALGAHHSGLMSNSDQLAEKLFQCGQSTDDVTWRLPLTEEYANQIVSNFADVANISTRGSGAGTITAGCFLQKFVGDYDWAHIDIAGVAWAEGVNKGATGRPMGLMSEFLINESNT
ncbi:MAG TPA: leucyl aminopeptidase [Gammaproteobacteria bacterium]|nr:leucyl aminopeptidase [Gammaproteobacteria bacterium]|tara:strand:- start:2015 stop:3517 length:1503 start_codon:yes stop_codon:yes gene_type:complete